MSGGRSAAQNLTDTLFSDERDSNNRFQVASMLNTEISNRPGPFWGCPAAAETPSLTRTKPPFDHTGFNEWRIVERHLLDQKYRIMNVWQLLGQGSVGSQTLTGLAALAGLAEEAKFWPFETNWDGDLEGTILTEIWPSLNSPDVYDHPIKDARQVMACRDWFLGHLNVGTAKDLFAVPDWLSEEESEKCQSEEGWILGVK